MFGDLPNLKELAMIRILNSSTLPHFPTNSKLFLCTIMDPTTPIWLSDDEDTSMVVPYSSETTRQRELDQCPDPYYETDDFKQNDCECLLVHIVFNMVAFGDLEGVRGASRRSDWPLVWENFYLPCTAIDEDQLDMLRLLIELCPDKNQHLQDSDQFGPGRRDSTPIRRAVEEGKYEAFKILLDSGVRIDPCRYRDMPLQQLAIEEPNLDIIKELQSRGFLVEKKYLWQSLYQDKPEIVSYVLDKKLNEKDRQKLLLAFRERGLINCIKVVEEWK